MVDRSKYRRTTELYVQGTEVVLLDGNVIWMQVLNPYEMEEARGDGQAARARLEMALREEGSDEMARVEAMFASADHEDAIEQMVALEESDLMLKVTDAIRDDPDWAERNEVMERDDELMARPKEDSERQLLERINREYVDEYRERMDAERGWLRRKYAGMDVDALRKEYINRYRQQRGMQVQLSEFQLTELWLAARACDGVQQGGVWDHSACEGHQFKVWESKEEVRRLPDRLLSELGEAIERLNMSVREAKNSDRRPSSSGSSQPPSEGEASTPSTPSETPGEPPTTSSSPSTTPSPSSASSSSRKTNSPQSTSG